MLTAINRPAEDTYVLSDIFDQEYFFVKNSGNKEKSRHNSCPVRLSLNQKDRSLDIFLGDFPVPYIGFKKETDSLRRISLGRLYKSLQSPNIRRLKITSSHFDYEDKTSLSFLSNLLLNIRVTKEFEFLVTDEKEILVQPINALISLALKNSKKMHRIALNLAYYDFPHEEFIRILRGALKGAQRLQELELKMYGEGIPFAQIFNQLMDSGKGWTRSLQRLVINCLNFDDRMAILRIFTYFTSLKHLKLNANKIDINDEILLDVLEDPTVIQKFETFDLSLKNRGITNEAVRTLLKRDFANLRVLRLEFGGSSINDGAFDGIIYHGMRNFNPAINIEFDLQDTDATQTCYNTMKYFLNRRLNGPDDDGEASVGVLRRRNDY